MSKDLIGYFSCDPETGAPVWDEGCVCGDNIFSVEGTGTVGRPIKFADTPVSAEPVGEIVLFGGDSDLKEVSWRKGSMPPPGIKPYTSPAATQPDVTQQTLNDVMAGIPARDAEIEALRKEIDTLRAQQDADTVDAERYRAWRDALITGKTAEDDFIRLVADSLPTSVGVSRRPTAAEWDAAIDAARKENSNA